MMPTTVPKTAALFARSANFVNTVLKSIVFGGEMTEDPKDCLDGVIMHWQPVWETVVVLSSTCN